VAKIHRASNSLGYRLFKNFMLMGLIWLCGLLILIVLEGLDLLKFFGIFIIIIISLISSIVGQNIRVLYSGYSGEKEALETFREFPDDYHIFTNLIFEKDGYYSEADLVILGPNGVFVTEVKNHNGFVTGDEKESHWKQIKVTDNGGRYVNHIYNPTRQVRSHVHKVAHNLRKKGYAGWVQSIVWFTNEEIELKINRDKTPIFSDKNKISDFILNYKPSSKITKEDYDSILKTLKTVKKNKKK